MVVELTGSKSPSELKRRGFFLIVLISIKILSFMSFLIILSMIMTILLFRNCSYCSLFKDSCSVCSNHSHYHF